jgi:hypothetical protein
MKAADDIFNIENHRDDNPSTWLALYLDQSVPMDPYMKRAYINSLRSRCRQYFLPLVKPFLHLLVGIFQIIKSICPFNFSAHRFLHKTISWGLYFFVKPEANLVILRHFHLGTMVINFLCDNLGVDRKIQEPLYPKSVFDISNDMNVVVQHDVNLYNFVIHWNKQGKQVEHKTDLNFDAVHEVDLKLEDFPNRWTNFLDVETACEMIAPFFQLLCTDEEYWRASISLQLDETIGVYMATLLNHPSRLFMVNNKHPLLPNNIVEAPRRLMLHGLSTEMVYQFLVNLKKNAN